MHVCKRLAMPFILQDRAWVSKRIPQEIYYKTKIWTTNVSSQALPSISNTIKHQSASKPKLLQLLYNSQMTCPLQNGSTGKVPLTWNKRVGQKRQALYIQSSMAVFCFMRST
ncbi:hypothetical protein V6N12_014932 [Hibiscus sabdariffa]|uniref:Uncharacterized protein n=1 Tax=Hibiscus sabdariffa TaxID=183260 RepID=A0ABR2DMH5_9ROSI